MEKKEPKKLDLTKETLHKQVPDGKLQEAVGGATNAASAGLDCIK